MSDPLVQGPDAARLRTAGLDPQRATRITAKLDQLLRDQRLGGMALRVRRRGVVLDWLAGTQDGAASAPFTAQTLLRLFSMTKPMTSAVLFSLFEEGRWLFDDPITRFLPELADLKVLASGQPPHRPVLMRDLLLHQAGFAYGIGDEDEIDRLYRAARVIDFSASAQAMLEKLATLPLANEPGTGRYSIAHDLQGLIAERLTGHSLDRLMRERLFEPLAMTDAAFGADGARAPRVAALHQHNAQGCFETVAATGTEQPMLWPVTPTPALKSGGAGVVATLADADRFLQMMAGAGALDGQRILAASTVRLMTASAADTTPAQPGLRATPGWWMRLDQPVFSGSCVSPGTLFCAGAGGNWGWIDPAQDLIVLGMLSVIGWNAPDAPSWAFDALIYQALMDD
jgi:CubicO group peptidase (beta-lactamase class C family)